VTGGQDPRCAAALQSAHRPEPGFQPPVVSLDRIIRVLLNGVQRRVDWLVEDPRIDGRAVGSDLDRNRTGPQRPGEEAPGGCQVARRGQQSARGEPATDVLWA
jgi:hypothetical protein